MSNEARLTLKAMIALRSELGLTQAEFADRLGVARTNLCAVEAGKRPFGPTMKARLALFAITRALDGKTTPTALYITTVAKEALDA